MSIKTTLLLTMTAALALNIAACKKNDPSAAPDNSGSTIGTPAPTATAVADGTVASYPTQVALGGTTRQMLQSFTVKQAADNNSATIGHIGVGTMINFKASYSNWYLIEFPTGVGQLSPGWIELRGGLSDPRLNQNPTPVATTTTTTTTVVDAGTPVVDAGTPVVDAGRTRPGIIIKPRR